MRFASRDLSNQFISLSYQDVAQHYNDGLNDYILDGYGYVIQYFPSSSIGYPLITSDVTSSMSVLSASYALTSSYETYIDISSSYSETASYSLFAETASYVDANNISNLYLPFEFTYKNVFTNTNPGAGNFNYDNSISSSIANIIISNTTAGGLDITNLFSNIKSGHQLYVQQKTDSSKSGLFLVSGILTNNNGWFTIPVSPISFANGGYPSNNKPCLFAIINNTTITTGSSYPITSSWANSSLSASYVSGSNGVLYQLDSNTINVSGSILADTTISTPSYKEGRLFWDNEVNTYAIQSGIGGSTLQIGHELWMRVLAQENIPNGSPVYISNEPTSVPSGRLALADGNGVKYFVAGIATHDIASGSIGIITTFGQIHDLNTSAYSIGDILYLSETISGSYQTTYPSDPHEVVICAKVLVSDATQGVIYTILSDAPPRVFSFVGTTIVPVITTGSGLIYVSTGSANICTTTDGLGPVKNFQLQSASFSINTSSFLDAQYLVANYNNGNPIYKLLTDTTTIDEIQSTLIYTITPGAGGNISIVDWDSPGILLANKLLHRISGINGNEREDGLILTESGSLGIVVSSGKVWVGSRNLLLPQVNSSGSRFVQIAHSASVWSSSLITKFNNTQYDDGNNLQPLTGNDYVVNYVYRGLGSLNTTIVILGNSHSTLTSAQLSQPPTLPPELKDISILIGRAIIRRNATNATQVDTAFTNNFASSGITIHNELSGLQGGIVGQYYHLTSTEYGDASSGSFLRQTGSLYGSASYSENAMVAVTSSFSNGMLSNCSVKTGSYALTTSDCILIFSGSSQLSASLPPASTNAGRMYKIKNVSPYILTITGSQNIDNNSKLFLNQWSAAELTSCGQQWYII